MAQALGHRHRRDVYNTFFATSFTLDGQILDFRCWEQPKHRMLAAYRAKKAPLVSLGFIPLRLFLQFFSPRFLFPHQRKDQIKNPCQYRIKRYMAQALRRRRIQNGSNSLLNSGGVKAWGTWSAVIWLTAVWSKLLCLIDWRELRFSAHWPYLHNSHYVVDLLLRVHMCIVLYTV